MVNRCSPVHLNTDPQQEGSKCASGVAHDPVARRRCLCSLLLLLACLMVLQGGISCGVIWYIGYRSSTSIANSLSSSIYQALLSNCVAQVNSCLLVPLQASQELKYHLNDRFPDLGHRLIVSNQTGWIAGLSYVAAKYPLLTRIGVNTRNGLTFGILRPTSLTRRAYLSDSGLLQVNIAEPREPLTARVVVNTFIPASSRLPPHRTIYNPPYNVTGEILPNDTVESIAYWLGSNTSSSILHPFERPYWIAGLELSQRGYISGWTKTFSTMSIGTSSGFIAISGLGIELDQNTNELLYVVSSTVSLENFHSVLQSLPLGEHGKAFLVRPSGHCVSSSVPSLVEYFVTNRSEFNLWTTQDPLTLLVVNLMQQHNFISSPWITPTNASLVMDPNPRPYHDSVHVDGRQWHVHMQMMDASSTGLYWTIVLVTLDQDFTGGVNETIITTVWLSVVVSISFILTSVVIVWLCVTQPVRNIANDMSVASSLLGKTQVDRQQLKQMCTKWKYKRFGSCCGYRGFLIDTTYEVAVLKKAFLAMVHSMYLHDELASINLAKRKFIRFIFHEVRVPFNAVSLAVNQIDSDIRLLTTYIKNSGGEGIHVALSCIDTLNILCDQTQVVSKILNDVLSMQQIEDGQLILENQWISLQDIIKATINSFVISCKPKQITMQFKSNDLVSYITKHDFRCRQCVDQHNNASNSYLSICCQVQVDPHRLRQVLSNLLSNAIRHTHSNGRIILSLDYEHFEPFYCQAELDTFTTGPHNSTIQLGQIMVTIRVCDTGSGIPSAAIPHLFDMYNHSHIDAGAGPGPGGLGLSITKKLVELFGGSIGVNSRVNYGSEFYFHIPMQVRLLKTDVSIIDDTDIDTIYFHEEDSCTSIRHVKYEQSRSCTEEMIVHPSIDQVDTSMVVVNSSIAFEPAPAPLALPFACDKLVPLDLCPKATYSASPYVHSRSIDFEKWHPDSLIATSHQTFNQQQQQQEQQVRRRILVVDDSLPNRKLVMKLITSLGYDVDGVENGQQCIDLFVPHDTPSCSTSCEFDGIIMDASMPIMSGLEATQILRQQGYKIPIIGLTANALMEDVNAFMCAGVNIVLTKPINKVTFKQVIERFIPR